MCLCHLIYTVRPCLIHTCHAAPMPCSDHAVLLKATAQHGRLPTAVLCCGLAKNGMVRAWHGRGMASVNQTRPHCVNQIEKTHSKPLAVRHGRGKAWARHAMCESSFRLPALCLPFNSRPAPFTLSTSPKSLSLARVVTMNINVGRLYTMKGGEHQFEDNKMVDPQDVTSVLRDKYL